MEIWPVFLSLCEPDRKEAVTLGTSFPWKQEGEMLRLNLRKADHTPGSNSPPICGEQHEFTKLDDPMPHISPSQ